MVSVQKFVLVLLLCFLVIPFNVGVCSDDSETLAETINNVVEKIETISSDYGVTYSQILSHQNESIYDTLITATPSDKEVIWIARLAELNNYSSEIINKTVIEVLNTTLSKDLLQTLYDRYVTSTYRYAKEFNISSYSWNFTILENYMANGESLFIDPNITDVQMRYYDENAQSLNLFLRMYLDNVDTSAILYADDEWLTGIQKHWNGQYYIYDIFQPTFSQIECEMGNFAQIITEYRNIRGDIPYYDRVILDLQYKLLDNNFSSPAWGQIGVIRHGSDNSQLRLPETLSSLIELQTLYSYFSPISKENLQNMLLSNAWYGLINSPLYQDNKFMEFSDANVFSDKSSWLGAMTLFLYGIVPETGNLYIEARNERYQDSQTCFNVSNWRFDYDERMIRIPVTQGKMTFIYGDKPVSIDFPTNGVYDIRFSDDWNNVVSLHKITNIFIPQIVSVSIKPLDKPINIEGKTPSFHDTFSSKNSISVPKSISSVTPTPVPTIPSQVQDNNNDKDQITVIEPIVDVVDIKIDNKTLFFTIIIIFFVVIFSVTLYVKVVIKK